MKLTIGAMKPRMYEFVEKGLAALKTPAMATSIRNAFMNHGRFGIARTAVMEASALGNVNGASIDLPVLVTDGVEEENFDNEGDSDSDSESD